MHPLERIASAAKATVTLRIRLARRRDKTLVSMADEMSLVESNPVRGIAVAFGVLTLFTARAGSLDSA
jgi:hypothetical protein